MGLGARNATQHDTAGVRKHAVVSSDYWEFQPGQSVMTREGIAGTVESVEDGPYPGTEGYLVTLVSGLGGGLYNAGELTDMGHVTAGELHDASVDYPELGDILTRRPDIAKG